jgi:hypothetical protein
MNRYTLTATLNGHTNGHIIRASNSAEATMEAIFYIADLAHANKTGAWAVGAIKLYDETGAVLHEMEAK